jgi:hypothetical protein
MPTTVRRWTTLSQAVVQTAAMVLIATLAGAGIVWTAAAWAGLVPWLSLTGTGEGSHSFSIGVGVQLVLTTILASLCFFLPTNRRVLQLEASHRSFHVGMDDVRCAYEAMHNADRAGVFKLKGEFDSMRERLTRLRAHPELGRLEPEILELAAQMSFMSRDLAKIYSDEGVARARSFLAERHNEAERLQLQIREAGLVARELRLALDQVEAEENSTRLALDQLRDNLQTILPQIGLHLVIAEQGPECHHDHPAAPAPEALEANPTSGVIAAE